jgi:hypothetical protein
VRESALSLKSHFSREEMNLKTGLPSGIFGKNSVFRRWKSVLRTGGSFMRNGFGKTLSLGIQHVLAMYAGAIVVPLIVGKAMGLTSSS